MLISFDSVVLFSDSAFFFITIPNFLGIYFLSKVVRHEILNYKMRADTGTLEVTPEDPQVGYRHDEPTEGQVANEKVHVGKQAVKGELDPSRFPRDDAGAQLDEAGGLKQ